MIFVILISNYATILIGINHYETKKSSDLFDIFHLLLPDLHRYSYIVDILGIFAVLSLVFVSTNEITNEFIAKFILIMFIRAFTIISTILPKHEKCVTNVGNIQSLILGDCYDKIFSGHTSFMLLLTLLYYREHIIHLPMLLGVNLLNIFLILATRSHYTVDVLLAIFVTTTIYSVKI